MSWDVDLINACKAKNFDLSITVTKHSDGSNLYSFTSNLTFDNYVLNLPADKDNPWWLVRPHKGRRPTLADLPVTPVGCFKTQQDADNAVHKGKRVVAIDCWDKTGPVATTTGDWFNKFVR